MTAPSMPANFPGQKRVPDQAERRINLKIPDQHGRIMHVVYDRINPGVVGLYPQFKAPWIPDFRFYEIAADEGIPRKGVWNYQAVLADNRAGWDRYFDELLTLSGNMKGIDAMAAYQNAKEGNWNEVPPALLRECGWTPDPDDYVKAAMAGNKWVLGFSDVIPKWAFPLVALKEARRAEEARMVKESDLDMYRDTDGADLDEEFEQKGLAGGTAPVTPKKPVPSKVKGETLPLET